MKISRLIIPFALLTAGISFVKCDYVADPETMPDVPAFDTTKRIAIIEEWTGHLCTNCPRAAEEIELLKNVYGQRFVAISIHDGFFATAPPIGMPQCGVGQPGAFELDLRCATAESYSAAHVGANIAPPKGMMNRLGMQSNTELKEYGSWSSHVDSITAKDAICSIHISHNYNTANRQITATVHGTWLMSHPNNLNINIMLLESGMHGWQLDGSACNSDFTFHHVLRECLNTPGSITGTPLTTAPTVMGAPYSYSLSSAYALPSDFDEAHCALVAIIYDTVTGEVMQCWEEPVQ